MKRRSVTLWDLIIWAFRDQKVHILNAHQVRQGYGRTATDIVCSHMELGTFVDGDAPHGASLRCHEDAEEVLAAVMQACSSFDDYRFVVEHAESGAAPSLDISYVPAKIVPVLRKNGRPSIIYDKNRNAIACEVERVGYTIDEKVSIYRVKQGQYRRFVALLDDINRVLSTGSIQGRRVQGLGVVREPWRSTDRRVRPKMKVLV